MSKTFSIIIGAIIGLVAGYPLSYLFQPGALRLKLSLPAYVQHIGDVFQNKELAPTAISVWIGSIIVFALLGLLLSAAASARRNNNS